MITADNTKYKDDFILNNVEDKNYLRILFNGGRAVQIRELNQMQSILQSQIDKFGSSIWKNGSAVIGGNCTFDRKIHTVSFLTADIFADSTITDINKISLLTQSGEDSGIIQADVIAVESESEIGGITKFYIRYSNGEINSDSMNLFDTTDSITIYERNDDGDLGFNTTSEPTEVGLAAGMFLSEGVFYTQGSFVITAAQYNFLPLTDEDDTVSGRVVLRINENYITYLDDQTLLDNATGMPNQLAPGADRYQILLNLDFIDDDSNEEIDTRSIIELMRVKDSYVQLNTATKYTAIDRQLAQRTFEESGNYVVNPFKIEVKDLVGSGRPIETVIVNDPDINAADKVYIGLEPSIAYVEGYRIALDAKLDMVGDRARDTGTINASLSMTLGNYYDVAASDSAMPIITDSNKVYELRNVETVVAKCRIKSIENTVTAGADYRVYVYDIHVIRDIHDNIVGNLADVNNIYFANGADDINLTVLSSLQRVNVDTGIFALPYQNVSSISTNPNTFVYTAQRVDSGTLSDIGGGIYGFAVPLAVNEQISDYSNTSFIVEHNDRLTTAFTVDGIAIIPTGGNDGDDIRVISPITITTSGTANTKTLSEVTDTNIVPSVGADYKLKKPHLFSISQILLADGAGAALSPEVDITNQFVVKSDGQHPSLLTNPVITYIGSGTPPPKIVVTYKHFSHNNAHLPYTINSYPVWDGVGTIGAGQITYDELPKFNGISLGDVIDFRPVILDDAVGVSNTIIIDPNSVLTCITTAYLNRIDKLTVNANGEFLIIKGTPAFIPAAPVTPPASMSLYELEYPAYTSAASDIKIKYIENRRYTMRDIGSLDKRVNRLEYFTALSALESNTNERAIFDEDEPRFKTGILVDSFSGHGIGDVYNPDYQCSIDRLNNAVRPKFQATALDLVPTTGNNNIRVNESTVTLNYTEVHVVSQLLSSESESVNPYDVATFVGTIKLFPTNDSWLEVKRKPDIIINQDGVNDALSVLGLTEGNVLGTEWNSWQTTWTGVTRQQLTPLHSTIAPDGVRRAIGEFTTTSNQIRDGVQSTLSSKIITENLGDRIVDISFVPFIRSRKVYFSVTGLKPLTRVYPFFDGINISQYCGMLDDTAPFVTAINKTSVEEYFNLLPEALTLPTGTLKSNANGELRGVFIIPNNSQLKFRTGERLFKLSDSINNIPQEESTFAETKYVASGSVHSTESTILSTRVPVIKRDRVSESRVTSDIAVRYYDPLAQSFLINDTPSGVFLSSVELWFEQVSKINIPITIRLVAVENGYPTQRVIPYSEVTLNPDDVSIWTLGDGESQSTRFEFSDPVYIKPGTEYAIVVLSNDPDYRIRVARLGGKGENNKIIHTNPYSGVMFMSQNASTWTADQTRDFKFRLNRANFILNNNSFYTTKTIIPGAISEIEVTDGGTSYTNPAGITVSIGNSGGGSGAAAFATVDLVTNKISKITLTNPGQGYSSNQIVTITGGGGSGATATANVISAPTSAYTLLQNVNAPEGTSVLNQLMFNASTLPIGNDVVYTPTAQFDITHSNSANLKTYLYSSNSYISPVLDLDNISLLSIHNIINNIQDDSVNLAKARYITREVELNDPTDQLNVYLDVNRPTQNTRVVVYAQVKYGSDTYADWEVLTPLQPIPIASNENSFTETAYVFTDVKEFNAFRIKIVMLSTNSVSVPSAKNLRIISSI